MVKVEARRVAGLKEDGRPPVERAPERALRSDIRGTASNVCAYAVHFLRDRQSQHGGVFSEATETSQRRYVCVSPIWPDALQGLPLLSTEHRRFAEADRGLQLPHAPARERGRESGKQAA